jgi:hypothetical protein
MTLASDTAGKGTLTNQLQGKGDVAMKGLVLLVLGVPMFFVTSMIDGATGRLP